MAEVLVLVDHAALLERERDVASREERQRLARDCQTPTPASSASTGHVADTSAEVPLTVPPARPGRSRPASSIPPTRARSPDQASAPPAITASSPTTARPAPRTASRATAAASSTRPAAGTSGAASAPDSCADTGGSGALRCAVTVAQAWPPAISASAPGRAALISACTALASDDLPVPRAPQSSTSCAA